MANRDDMSFKRAFADARRELGAGKTFTWRGNRYTTDYAEDSSRAPRRSSTPTPRPSRARSVDQVREDSERAITRATANRMREEGNLPSRESVAARTRSRSNAARRENALPAPVERMIAQRAETPSQEREARTVANRAVREGESTDFITRTLRSLFSGFRQRQAAAREAGREQSGRNQQRNERLNEMRGLNKGGSVKSRKSGYAKGGMVKANCGASMKPNRKAKK